LQGEIIMVDIVHIHPMLVHFPIVLYLLAAALQLLVLLRQDDLSGNSCLANTAFASLLLAAAAAVVAAFFGDIALDHAVELGFPSAPLERHASLGITTMTLMLVLSTLHIAARWFHWRLSGARGWMVWGVAAVGAVLLVVTAYFGGELVYHIGVNIDTVTPRS
jgi:uncharacterized membrane protein